jgi:2-oxoglutarate dehydrogenase E1 component
MKEAINSTDVNNLAYVDALYARYLRDQQSVPEAWRDYFAGWRNGADGEAKSGPSFRARSLFNPGPIQAASLPAPEADQLQASVRDRLNQLIRNYRVRGHMLAELDPLGTSRPHPPELEPGFYGLPRQRPRPAHHLFRAALR